MTINELKFLLSRFHIRPDKKLGQNFLLSEKVLDQIVIAAELTTQDTVLEIGPGLGALTRKLAEKAGLVLAVEKDRKLVRALRKLFKNKKNVKILQGDALFFDPQAYNLQANSYKLVANIPYYITGKLLQNFLSSTSPALRAPSPRQGRDGDESTLSPGEERVARPPASSLAGEVGRGERLPARPALMVLLLQKEVAERIVARPGQMSLLSVSVQFYAEPEIISVVPKENFYPMPEVDSAIVRLVPPHPSPLLLGRRGRKGEEGLGPRFSPSLNPSPLAGEGRERGVDEKKFFQLVKVGFANKRKQLHNNLTAGLPGVTPEESGVYSHSLDSRPRSSRGQALRGNDKHKRDYKSLLSSLGLKPLARAQDLSLSDWEKLYHALFF